MWIAVIYVPDALIECGFENESVTNVDVRIASRHCFAEENVRTGEFVEFASKTMFCGKVIGDCCGSNKIGM
jgi:hypothetical protein